MMQQRLSSKGSILMELLVACFVVSLVMPFLISAVSRLNEQQLRTSQYLLAQEVENALIDHLKAQWSRLLPAGCLLPSHTLIIQSSEVIPLKLKRRALDKASDWLGGIDYGLCRFTMTARGQQTHLVDACDWKLGDPVTFTSCVGRYSASITSVNSQGMVVSLASQDGIGQSGILESEQAFYWYLADGKNGTLALWRTPSISGRSLELWAGLERMALYPLLDTGQDGLVDSIDTRHGEYALNQVRAIWVEFIYRLPNCVNHFPLDASYQTMRGEVWSYQPPCTNVGKRIIPIQGG